jgi:hypothetical protein
MLTVEEVTRLHARWATAPDPFQQLDRDCDSDGEPALGVPMIVRDEEQWIERALRALHGVADHILV